MTATDLAATVPALVLAGSAVVATILAIPRRLGARILGWLGAIACIAVAAIAIAAGTAGSSGTVARDGASAFFVALIAIVTAVTLALAAAGPRRGVRSKDEVALALFAACGGVVVVCAADLVVLFVGLALLTIPLYVLTGRQARGDGVMRHFLLGATSSAVALYGIALLYAATGETSYTALGRATHNPLYLAGLGLTLAGLVSHVLIAPGQRWSLVTNVAVVGSLARLIAATAAGEVGLDWQVSLASLAAVAFLIPGLAALGERHVGRLVGYAMVSQLAYVALAAASAALPAAALALATSTAVAVGVFAVLAILPAGDPALADLAGLARNRPLLVVALAALVLGLIGVPPAIGFLAKVYVLEAAIRAQLLWLVVLGLLASVVSAAAYTRLVLACFAAPRLDAVAPPRMRAGTAVAVVIAAATLAAGIVPGPLLDAAQGVRFF